MKLKSLPEDFRVEELTAARPSRGPFALYRLEKKGIGTPEAISAILRDWNLSRKAVSYGGLKDRHAITTQYITIYRGPNKSHQDRSYRLEYMGQVAREYQANDIRANRFSIRLRNVEHGHHQDLERRCEAVREQGVVNYFDDQRFGSIGHSGELIAVPWCKGNYERALYLALAEENCHDRGREREQKELMRAGWGDWERLKRELDRSHRRSVVTYLVDHPKDFKRAMALIRQDMRGIYLAAFQSWVWNRWLAKLIETSLGLNHCIRYEARCGMLAIPAASANMALVDRLRPLELPLPSARQHDWDESTLPALDEILGELGMERREMRLKYPRDTFFSRGKRKTWLIPERFEYRWGTDELNNRRLALDLAFELPRGCYATMVVRAIASQDFESDQGDQAEWESTESDDSSDTSEIEQA